MKIFQNKYLITFVLFLAIGLFSGFFVWFLSPQMKEARQLKKGLESFNKVIKAEEQKYAQDTYGGKTPEETYQMFLDALKNKDIDLAIKYFAQEKQEEYKKLLTQIEKNGQWEELINDLLLPQNQKGKYLDKETYVIEVINNKKEEVTTIVLKIPTIKLGTDIRTPSNIWKITSF